MARSGGGLTLGRPALNPSGAGAVLIAPGNQSNLTKVLIQPERNDAFENDGGNSY